MSVVEEIHRAAALVAYAHDGDRGEPERVAIWACPAVPGHYALVPQRGCEECGEDYTMIAVNLGWHG